MIHSEPAASTRGFAAPQSNPDTLDLVVMCYEAAIKDLREAKVHHESQRTEASYDRIRHAQDVVTELLVGLDYERGGQLAQNLSRIYNFLLRELIGINSKPGTQTYDQLIAILAELKGAWEQIRLQAQPCSH